MGILIIILSLPWSGIVLSESRFGLVINIYCKPGQSIKIKFFKKYAKRGENRQKKTRRQKSKKPSTRAMNRKQLQIWFIIIQLLQ